MSIVVHCVNPACSKPSSVAIELVEKRLACPHCRTPLPAIAKPESFVQEGIQAKPPTDGSPASIGRFLVRSRLGSGAFGAVYRAYDPQVDREVAVKVPLPGSLGSPQHIERFLREARAAAQLRHPHIVPLFEAGGIEPDFYIASAFIEGHTVASAIDKGGMELKARVRIMRQLAEALAYAHEQGIVHRDVKPSNVMLDGKGDVHLMDFGLAYRRDSAAKLTQEGAIVGTPAYLAPELATGREGDPQPACDQYSLGVVFYELLCGRLPFEGPAEVILFHATQSEPNSPRKFNAKVSRDVETICLKTLAKRPADRYASCHELADDLRRFLEGEPIKARPLSWSERTVRWVWRNPAIAGLIVSVATVLLLGASVASYYAVQAGVREQEALANARKADDEKDRANAERNRAVEQKNRADNEKQRADVKAREANDEKHRADMKAREANAEKEQTRRLLYVAQMNLAPSDWRDAKMARLAERLAAWYPAQDQADLRGFEWYYLSRLGHRELVTLKGHTQRVLSVAISPDGRWLASGSNDGTVKVWNSGTSVETLTIKLASTKVGHSAPSVYSVAFSPDGKRLASGSSDAIVKVWDVGTGKEVLTLEGHKSLVHCVAFSADGKWLASVSGDRTIKVWDFATGMEAWTLNGNLRRCLAFSPDSKYLVGCELAAMKLWDAGTGKEMLNFRANEPGDSELKCMAISPDGKWLVGAGFLGTTIKVWNVVNGEETLAFQGHTDPIASVAFSPDSKRLVSGSEDGTVRVWDIGSRRETLALKGHAGGVNSVAFTPDGKRIASGGDDNTVKIWDPSIDQEALLLTGHTAPVGCAVFSPDGKRLFSGSNDYTVKAWDVATGKVTMTLSRDTRGVNSIALSPDGKRLASGNNDHTVTIWDAATGEEIRTLFGHPWNITCVVYSPDGKTLVTCDSSSTVKFWNTSTFENVLTTKKDGIFHRVVFSPDGKWLVSDGLVPGEPGRLPAYVVKVWDAATLQETSLLKGHTNFVHSLAFSRDGRWLASGSRDETIKVWNFATGQEVMTLKGHSRAINSIAFSPDGKRLFSGSWDQTAKVWDLATAQEALSLRHAGGLMSVALSPDGQKLASCSQNILRVWDATPMK